MSRSRSIDEMLSIALPNFVAMIAAMTVFFSSLNSAITETLVNLQTYYADDFNLFWDGNIEDLTLVCGFVIVTGAFSLFAHAAHEKKQSNQIIFIVVSIIKVFLNYWKAQIKQIATKLVSR